MSCLADVFIFCYYSNAIIMYWDCHCFKNFKNVSSSVDNETCRAESVYGTGDTGDLMGIFFDRANATFWDFPCI